MNRSEAAQIRWRRPEYRAKQSQSKGRRKPRNPAVRALLLEEACKPKSPRHRKRIGKALRGRRQTSEHKEKNRQAALLRWKDPAFRERMLKSVRSPERRANAKASRMRQTQIMPNKQTSIERALDKEFRKLGLSFETNQPIFDRFIPDFIFRIPRLIVEADGNFWHQDKDHKPLAKAAARAGWTTMRFPESVIKGNAAACAQAVFAFTTTR